MHIPKQDTAGIDVLSFAEALAACGGVPIYCEVKTDGNEVNEEFLRKVYDLIKTYDSQIVVVSFNPFVLRWFKDNHPELIRGFLSCDFSETKGKPHPLMYKALANLMSNFLAKPDFISYRFTDKSFGLNMCRFYAPCGMDGSFHGRCGTRRGSWLFHLCGRTF